MKAGTITKDEKQQIERLPERRSAALVDLLYTCRRPKAIAQFLEILSNDEMTACKWITDEVHEAAHEKVVSTCHTIVGSWNKLSLNDDNIRESNMKQYLSRVYKKSIRRIVASFDPKGYILDSLFEKGTITIQEKQQIERLSEGRGAALVDKLFLHRKPNAIAQFLEIVSFI